MSDVHFDAGASSSHEESNPQDSDHAELEALRRELDEARPRLAAFAALEEMAEAQGSTPEAIALQASIEMLESAEADKRAAVEQLEIAVEATEANRATAAADVDELIEQRDALRAEIVEVLDEHTGVMDQVAEMIDELESIRADAVRLLGEKATLEMKVEALRNEVDGFVVERRSESAGIIDDDDEATAFDAFFEAEVVEDKARAWMLE